MNICIVGHGPSLKGSGKGKQIDSHDFVVRMKKGQQLTSNPEDYGTKTNCLVASTEVIGTFMQTRGLIYLAYPKFGWYSEKVVKDAEEALKAPIIVPLNLCNYWNWKFRNMGGRHNNVSTGTASIIMISAHYQGSEIYLAGFDTLLDPSKPFTRIEEVPRTGFGPFPDHDWHMENRLLRHIEKEHRVSIQLLE